MSWQKEKGTSFETEVVRYGRSHGLMLWRKPLHGARDEGDVDGYEINGRPVTAELKNCKDMRLSEFTNQARVEAENAGTPYFVVIHKRKGAGARNFGLTYVTTTLECWNRMVKDSKERDGGGR